MKEVKTRDIAKTLETLHGVLYVEARAEPPSNIQVLADIKLVLALNFSGIKVKQSLKSPSIWNVNHAERTLGYMLKNVKE